ncbi:MAG: SBBP repeat-containing protein [Terriglobia bacterium]|jgi:hypothetical protein
MKHRKTVWKSCVLMLCFCAGYILQGGQVSHQLRRSAAGAVPAGKPAVSYAQLPLSFEANQGQTDERVKFLSHGRGYGLFLTGDEAVLELQDSGFRIQDSGPRAKPFGAMSALQWRKGDARRATDSVLRLKLVNANQNAAVTGTNELPGKVNYFLGNDPKKWLTNLPTYAQVRYRNVYPGIDLVYYGNQGGQLEYDFVVAPGADPGAITLGVGAQGQERNSKLENRNSAAHGSLQIARDGDLVIPTKGGELRFHKPVVYQDEQPGAKDEIRKSKIVNRQSRIVYRQFREGHFTLDAQNRVQFALGPYDHTQPLVIDPVLVYSTYLGGNFYDSGNAIAADSSGNAYVTGVAYSTNFPTAYPLQASCGGCVSPCEMNAFVAKMNWNGSALSLVYSTYLGGNLFDHGSGIAVDSSGNAYVTGYTESTNFPTAYPLQASLAGVVNAFVAELNATGSALVYSTYLGGSLVDYPSGIAVDSSGNTYLSGSTGSPDFPTANPLQASRPGSAFVAKLNWNGSALSLVYSTYLGGSTADGANGIAVDSSGNAYVTGITESTNFPTTPGAFQTSLGGTGITNAFVAKLNWNGSALSLVYSTYLGGNFDDEASGIAVDSSGNAYVTGQATSTNFPTVNPLQASLAGFPNAFVAELNPAGSALVYSTYLGGSGHDSGSGIAVDSSGNAYVTGATTSTNFPTANPLQASLGAPPGSSATNAFIAELNWNGSALSLVFSTYLGGSACDYLYCGVSDYGNDIAVDPSGNLYVTGQATSSNFPTANPLQASLGGNEATNAFVAKISAPAATGVQLSPVSLAFKSEPVGSTSPAQSVTLTNSSTGSLNLTSITSSGDFALAPAGTSCPYSGGTVASGATCTILVTFTPTGLGTRSGLVTINDNAPGSPQSVSLTGTAVTTAPVADLSPGTLTFGGQWVGTTSAAQPVAFSNTGNTALTLSSIGISGNNYSDFSQTNNCGSSVAAGGSCTINVTFTPSSGGTLTGTLIITDNSNNTTGSTQTVSLSGAGQDFTLTTPGGIPPTATVAPGQTATYTFSVGSEGGFNQTVTFTCTGAPSESTCAVSPNPAPSGSNITVTVTTTAPSASAPRTLPPPRPRLPGPQALLMLAAFLAGVAWTARAWREVRPSRRRTVLLPLAAGLLLALGLAGCGGGGGGSHNPGTPAGTYFLTVTGTAGSGSTARSHSLILTLNVS